MRRGKSIIYLIVTNHSAREPNRLVTKVEAQRPDLIARDELNHEGVGRSAGRCLEDARGRGKVGRPGIPGHISVPGGIDSDTEGPIIRGAKVNWSRPEPCR